MFRVCEFITFYFVMTASHVSQYPSLNFLIYVPKATESPLFIRLKSDLLTQTDNFLIPQWGGVVFYNQEQPPSGGRRSNETIKDEPHKLGVKMEVLMSVFVEQIKMLLGVPHIVRYCLECLR